MTRISEVGHHEGFAEGRDADAADVRVLARHLADDLHDPVHDGADVDLMPRDPAPHRIIPVRLAQIFPVFIEHRAFAAGGAGVTGQDESGAKA